MMLKSCIIAFRIRITSASFYTSHSPVQDTNSVAQASGPLQPKTPGPLFARTSPTLTVGKEPGSTQCQRPRENHMTLGTILLIVLILLLIGALPSWPHSRSWGYGPTGGLGLVLIIVIVLLLMGRI